MTFARIAPAQFVVTREERPVDARDVLLIHHEVAHIAGDESARLLVQPFRCNQLRVLFEERRNGILVVPSRSGRSSAC